MCECYKNMSKELLEKCKELYPSGALHRVDLKCVGNCLSTDLSSREVGFTPIELRVEVPTRKNPKDSRTKVLTHFELFNYCPFCGEKQQKIEPRYQVAIVRQGTSLTSGLLDLARWR